MSIGSQDNGGCPGLAVFCRQECDGQEVEAVMFTSEVCGGLQLADGTACVTDIE